MRPEMPSQMAALELLQLSPAQADSSVPLEL
jgi:hypothetical protein